MGQTAKKEVFFFFFKYVNSKRTIKKNTELILEVNGYLTSNIKQKVEAFNAGFNSNWQTLYPEKQQTY